MAVRLCIWMCSFGLLHLVTSTNRNSYHAGSTPIGSRTEVHGASTYFSGLPGHGHLDGAEIMEQAPKTISSEMVAPNIPAPGPTYQRRGNRCSYVKSQIVTYADLCKTEKYVIRSQQPCPYGTPDCQRVMYRLAQKPMYKLKRKEVTSLEWRCCRGYIGTNCEQTDPNAIVILSQHTGGTGGVQEAPSHPDPNAIVIPSEYTTRTEDAPEDQTQSEVSEIIQAILMQESLLEDIQNDIHLANSNLLDLQTGLDGNGTNESQENQTKIGIDDRLLREVFLPHVESFLKEHFNPMWNSFNKSLQNLSSTVKNLSESVVMNRRRMDAFLESTVPKKDLYELGAKFESKIQENIVKIDQLKHDMDNHLHTQQAGIHYNLTMIKADTDMKLKRNQKSQQSQFTELNNGVDELRRGQEKIQDDIQAISHNITELWISYGPRESSQVINHHLNETLEDYLRQIKDLYTESDAAFENISTLEKWVKELRTQTKTNADAFQVAFMEKSLIMEENKEFLLRQIMDLNYTILSMQEHNDDLLKNCDCQKITMDILALEDKQNNFSILLRDALHSVEEVKKREGSSKMSFENSVDDLSMVLQLNQQSLTAQQEQGRKLMHITTQLKSQANNVSDDVAHLKKDNELINNRIKLLDSSFSSLLEDAIRHDRALGALLGEEILDVLSDDNPEALKMSILQIYDVLNETLNKLEKQQLATDSLMHRVNFLELQPRDIDSPASSTIFNVEQQIEDMAYDDSFKQRNREHMEPSHEASRRDVLDESEYTDIMTLKNDIKHLGVKVKTLESYFSEGNQNCNETIAHAITPLNISIGSIKSEIASLRELFGGHIQLFQKIFGNYESLLGSNVTLDIAKVQMIINQKMTRNHKNEERQNRRRGKKQTEQLWQSDAGMNTPKQDSPVIFSAAYSQGAEGFKILRFNEILLNYGSAFSPEDGHFTAPHSGVYAFAISMDFGPGSSLGHLNLGRHKISLHSNSLQQSENIKHQFAVVELQKDDKVWLELLHGSVKKKLIWDHSGLVT